MRLSHEVNNFTAGELTPRLYGRTDLEYYKNGCKTLENVYVYPQGGVNKRPGSYYISTAGDTSNKVRLIPFVYSENNAYILEFGENYIRFFTAGGQITTSAGAYEISTPYQGDELAELKFIQTADVMYLTHPDHKVRKLSRYAHTDWTLNPVTFYGGPFLDENTYDALKMTPSKTTGNIEITVDNVVKNGDFTNGDANWDNIIRGSGLVAFPPQLTGDGTNFTGIEQEIEVNSDYDYVVTCTISNNDMHWYVSAEPSGAKIMASGNLTTGSKTFSFSPSADNIFLGFQNEEVTYSQIADVVCKPQIFDSDHVGAYWKFSGTDVTTANISTSASFSSEIEVDSGDTFIFSVDGTWTGTITLQRSYDGGTSWSDYYETTSNTSVEVAELQDGVKYRAGCKGGVSITGTAELRLSKIDQYGYVEITSVTDAYTANAVVKKTIPSTDSTERWAEGAFSTYQGFPHTCAFFEQRLILAGTDSLPTNIWGSKTDDYENFETGTSDDDSYSFLLASSKINDIQWLLDKNYLLVGTLGGEWKFGFSDQTTTPTSYSAERQTTYGSTDIQAQTMGHIILFIQKAANKLRTMSYDWQLSGYKSGELSQIAEHLLDDGIKEIAVTDKPDPLILMVTDSGDIICCTFDIDNKVFAFSKWETDGDYESIATIPSSDRDEIWTCVKRTIKGVDYRYIEQFQSTNWTSLSAGFFVDCGLSYSGTATLAVSGLSHLEGKQINAMGDGAALNSVTVTGGVATFNTSSEQIHVGLAYTSKIETMDFEVGNIRGTSQTKRKKIHEVAIKFLNSVGCDVGYTDENGADEVDTITFRDSSMSISEAVPLYSGDKILPFNKGWSRDQSVTLKNSQPLPWTVLAIVTTMNTSQL